MKYKKNYFKEIEDENNMYMQNMQMYPPTDVDQGINLPRISSTNNKSKLF